jgi:hypothetical protein
MFSVVKKFMHCYPNLNGAEISVKPVQRHIRFVCHSCLKHTRWYSKSEQKINVPFAYQSHRNSGKPQHDREKRQEARREMFHKLSKIFTLIVQS